MASCVRFAWLMGALLLGLLAAHPANAQAARTWISGVGDDANPCSRTAPCKTFAGAITKTAGGGEIDCLDPGGFGAVTVTKAITLDCGGGIGGQVGSILASGTNGININAGASDSVTIRNMTINGFNGSGVNGIKFNTGGSLTIENTSIFGFGASSGAGVSFQPSAAGSKLIMRNVEVQNNVADAIYISPIAGVSAAAVVSDVLATGNGVTGLHVTDGAAVTARNSLFGGNGGKGVHVVETSAATIVNLDGNTIASNAGQGVLAVGTNAMVRISNNAIYNNSTGLQSASGGQIVSFQNNRNFGNGTNGAPTATANLQ